MEQVPNSSAVGYEVFSRGQLSLSPMQKCKGLLSALGFAWLPPPHASGDVVAPPPTVSQIDRTLAKGCFLPPHHALRLFCSMIRSRSWRSNRSFLSRSTVGILPRCTFALSASLVRPK